MKNIIIPLIALTLCLQAQAQERILSTADGVTYTGITHQRVEPNGLYIEYNLPEGGIGMAKVKFSRLSRAQQKQFGLNRADAREYEAAVVQANEDVAQELIHRYEVARNARRQRDAENESAYPARMAEITRLNAAQAATIYGSPTPENPASSSFGYTASFGTANSFRTQTTYSTANGADLFPNRNIVRRAR